MELTPNNKIKVSRIKDLPELSNNTGKVIVCDNGEIKYVSKNGLYTYLSLSNVVSEFKILGMNDSLMTYKGGSVISPEVNGKRYVLKFEDGVVDTNKSFEDGGCCDAIRKKPWQQPLMTSNTTPDEMTISCSDQYDGNYPPFRAFNGTNTANTDCWHSLSNGVFPKWIQADLKYPITIEKFAIQNRTTDADNALNGSATNFKIWGRNLNGEWVELVYVDGVNSVTTNRTSASWAEYVSKDDENLYNSIKYEIYNSVSQSYTFVARFQIIGHYKGYRIPDSTYNVFVIGKENEENPEARIITTLEEFPEMPKDYTYGVKLGSFKTAHDYSTLDYYPCLDLNESYNHGFVVLESLTNPGYRIYSDGWKKQWGTNANPVFPIAFEEIPLNINRGASAVTKTGMTIEAGYWIVEGY